MRYGIVALIVLMAAAGLGCQRTPGEVVDKVLVDFGVREKPEGYVSGSDLVFEKLPEIGQAELKRLNVAEREGTIAFQEERGLHGKYYKEAKVYEDFYPLDVKAVSRSSSVGGGERGYVGYIEFSYRIYQSERVSSRTEAAAQPATIPTDEYGRETWRYRFTANGAWDGAKGEKARR